MCLAHLRSITSITNSATKAPIIMKILGRSASVSPVDPIFTSLSIHNLHSYRIQLYYASGWLHKLSQSISALPKRSILHGEKIRPEFHHKFTIFTGNLVALHTHCYVAFRLFYFYIRGHAVTRSQQKQWSSIEKGQTKRSTQPGTVTCETIWHNERDRKIDKPRMSYSEWSC